MAVVRDTVVTRELAGALDFSPEDYYRELLEEPRRLGLPPDALPSPSAGRRPAPSVDGFDALIRDTASRFRVDPALVKAVIAAESNFEADAVSHMGAQGLMQLMPEIARALGVRSPFEPAENVEAGVRYLREMLDRYGDTHQALAAYNAGPEAVDRHGGIPPYRETRDYVRRVLDYYDGYRGQF